MTSIDVNEALSPARYLTERVETQLRWYGDRSASAKRWYLRLQLLSFALAASVPVLSLSSGDVRARILVAVIGALATLAAGVLALYRFGERWTDYRSTAESIKHEKYRYLTRSAPYDASDAFSRFVNRVESIILHENRAWREKTLERDGDVDTDETASSAGSPPTRGTSVGSVDVRLRAADARTEDTGR